MQCDEIYLNLLSGHIDGSNSEAEERQLQQHLEVCPQCRELLQIMEENDILLAQSTQQPPEDLTARIMDAVKKEPKKKPNRKRFYWSTAVAGLATAALLCLALLGDKLPLLPEKNDTSADAFIAYEDSVAEDAPIEENFFVDAVDEEIPESHEYNGDVHAEAATEPVTTIAVKDDTPQMTETVPAEAEQELQNFTLPDIEISGEGNSYEPSSQSTKKSPDSQLPIGYSYGRSSTVVPTLVIWGASSQEVRLPFSAAKGEFSTGRRIPIKVILYDHFLSALFALRQPVFTGTDGTQFITPAYEAELYTLSYNELCDLFQSCTGKYELALYFPKELTEIKNCQVILIASASSAGIITSSSATE